MVVTIMGVTEPGTITLLMGARASSSPSRVLSLRPAAPLHHCQSPSCRPPVVPPLSSLPRENATLLPRSRRPGPGPGAGQQNSVPGAGPEVGSRDRVAAAGPEHGAGHSFFLRSSDHPPLTSDLGRPVARPRPWVHPQAPPNRGRRRPSTPTPMPPTGTTAPPPPAPPAPAPNHTQPQPRTRNRGTRDSSPRIINSPGAPDVQK